jgi:hypothetical protein
VELIEGHGAGRPAGAPGCRRARGPGCGMGGLSAGCLRSPGDPGREADASPDSSGKPGFRQAAGRQSTSRWSEPVRSRVAGVQEGMAARWAAPGGAVTLSDACGQGERAHSRRSGVQAMRLPR